MSMVTYIGLNFPVKIAKEVSEDKIEITYAFSEEKHRNTVKQKHFTTPYIYELWTTEQPIWDMNEYQKTYSPHNYEKAKTTFLFLCSMLKELLPQGDYCEVYICWLDEEEEEYEKELKIDLNDLPIGTIDIAEKCLIRLEN